ncbi:transposable element Tcb1 transposase [Trichonephila clavipes]|nr:transposable element Tcb1 transposase [Trichonephila clavipes]
MQTCKELSEVQNGIIFGFREKVGSISETAKFVDCSCVTVVKRLVRENRRATVKQHTTQMNQGATNSVFQTTVQLSLLRLVLRSRRLVLAPMLTAVHQKRRLEFSYRYRNWASNER